MLLDLSRDLKITDEMLEFTKETDDMEILLQRRSKAQTISSKVLEKVASNLGNSETLVSQLLKHDKSVKITPPVVRAAFKSFKESFVRMLFERDPTLDFTQEDLKNLVHPPRPFHSPSDDETRRKIVTVLFEYGKTVEFSDEIRKTLDEKFQSRSDKEMKEMFYKLERRHI